jgi:opacity protein-like surface antigen
MFVVGIATLAVPVFAESEEPLPKQDVSVQAFGSFLKTTTQNGIENKADKSAGVLGTYRYFFTEHQGVEANYGYTQNTQTYGLPGNLLGVKAYSHEISGAYVFRVPLGRITPFVLGGAGALVFDPNNVTGATRQTRAIGVYGAGAEINLSRHAFVRAEYRGLIYNSPIYGMAALADTDRVTHRAEPTVGFGWRF